MNEKLVNAVYEQLGFEDGDEELETTLQDIANHGIGGGFGGFIYFSDTVEFFDNHRHLILEAVSEMAADFGQDSVSFVVSFNCLDDDIETREEAARTLYGSRQEDDRLVANALAWFAAEEVARYKTNW